MRCGAEEMKHCRKKTENGQVWGWGQENPSGVMSQAGYCSSVSPGAARLLSNVFWGLRGHDSATGTECEQLFGQALHRGHRGTAVPKVTQSREGLDLQSTSSLDSSAARHWDYMSSFLFLLLGRLMVS